MDIDQGKLEAFMGQMIGHMTGGRALLQHLAGRRAWPLPRAGGFRAAYRGFAGREDRLPPAPGAASGSTARPPAAWWHMTRTSDTYELGPEAAMALGR